MEDDFSRMAHIIYYPYMHKEKLERWHGMHAYIGVSIILLYSLPLPSSSRPLYHFLNHFSHSLSTPHSNSNNNNKPLKKLYVAFRDSHFDSFIAYE